MPNSDTLHCPRCLSSLSLRLVAPFALRGIVLYTPNLGVECPRCGAKLRIVRTRLLVAWGILLALLVFGLGGLTSFKNTGRLDATVQLQLLCLLFALIGALLFQVFTPNLLQARLVRPGEPVTYPLGTPKAEEDATPGWICNHCHEKNPEYFEICWKCEHAKPKSTGI